MEKLTIATPCLKDFLSLFSKKDVLINLELGDTYHPSSGYIDESILENKRIVADILAFPYDFRGLVIFYCTINDLKIELNPEGSFEVVGVAWKIRQLTDKMMAFNAEKPDLYVFKVERNW
ncbi:MAG: hypothetical protein U5L45_13710 [Saprospiraceae bacterium]|nr:hypothetical protein [Saprospiraceae bacterium]